MRKLSFPMAAVVAFAGATAANAVVVDLAFGGTITAYRPFQPDYASFDAAVPIGASVVGQFRFETDIPDSVEVPAQGHVTIAGVDYALKSEFNQLGTLVDGYPVNVTLFSLDGPTLAAPDADHGPGSLYLYLAIGTPDPFAVSPKDYAYTSVNANYPDPDGYGGNSVFSDLTLDYARLSIAPVPEPASWVLFAAGFGFAGASVRRARVKIAFA